MSHTTNWRASVKENRVAWIIACICIAIISSLSTWPNLMVFKQGESPATNTRHAPATKKPALKPVNKVADKKKPAKKAAPAAPIEKKRPAAKRVKTPATIGFAFYVQVGAFKQVSRAQGLVKRLKQQGWAATMEPIPGQFHAVWIGPTKSRILADDLRNKIYNGLKIKGFIVRKTGE